MCNSPDCKCPVDYDEMPYIDLIDKAEDLPTMSIIHIRSEIAEMMSGTDYSLRNFIEAHDEYLEHIFWCDKIPEERRKEIRRGRNQKIKEILINYIKSNEGIE